MDSKMNAATWALDRGVSVVICNGMLEKAIKTIMSGRKVGTFFTDSTTSGGSTPVEVLAENGALSPNNKTMIYFQYLCCYSETRWKDPSNSLCGGTSIGCAHIS